MKTIRIFILTTLVLFVFTLPAFAGGWAVVTLDHLPDKVVAGQRLTIGLVVRQHGHTPLDGLKLAIRYQKVGDPGDDIVYATSDGNGHYTASFTLPSKGEWDWTVETGFRPEKQPMPSLTVVAASGTTGQTTAPAPTGSLPSILGVVGLVVGVGSLVVFGRTKSIWAVGTAVIAIVLGVTGLAVGSSQAAPSTVAIVEPRSAVELGQRLFVAKGCVVCHTHDAVQDVKQVIAFNYDVAPNLTDFTAKEDYLTQWLHDPASIKPQTEMPNLKLSDAEIGSLVAFINAP